MKTNCTRTVIIVLLVIAIAGSAVHSQSPDSDRVWFAPNVGSVDMLQLFIDPTQWDSTRSRVDVFKFYASHLVAESGYPLIGQNKLSNFVGAQAFSQLSQWGIKIGFEAYMGPMTRLLSETDTLCQTRTWAIQHIVLASEEPIQNVESNGGLVSYISMDEPLMKAAQFLLPDPPITSCYSSLAEIAQDVAQYMAQIQSVHQAVLIGDIEPYPHFSIYQIEQWIIALENEGLFLPFFHLDVGMGKIRAMVQHGTPIDLAGDLQELQSFLAARSIAFGVIFTDTEWDALSGYVNGVLTYNPDYDGRDYYNNTINLIQTVTAAIGGPDHILFQSWRESYDTSGSAPFIRQLPVVLPENDSLIFSHTRLINAGLDIIDLPTGCCMGVRGDVNGDGNDLDIVDMTCIVDFMFGSGCIQPCPEEADPNGDASVSDILDMTFIVDFLFGTPPALVSCP